jgi:hypothetical protein
MFAIATYLHFLRPTFRYIKFFENKLDALNKTPLFTPKILGSEQLFPIQRIQSDTTSFTVTNCTVQKHSWDAQSHFIRQ